MPRVSRIFRWRAGGAAAEVTHLGEVVTHLGEPVTFGSSAGEIEYGKVYRGTTLVFSKGAAPPATALVFVYYPYYNQSRMPAAQYFDWSAATHLVHYNVEPNANGTLRSGMVQADRDELIPVAHAYNVKVLINIGGAGAQSADFPAATATSGLRATLISNLIALVNDNGYDGVDLNWEPMTDNTSVTLKNQYIAFAAELRTALGPSRLLTCSSFSAFAPLLAAAMNPSIDYFLLQGYGMWAPYDAGETESWHHTALFNGGLTQASDGRPLHSLDFMLSRYSALPQSKLVVGLGGFGIIWTGGTGMPQGGVTGPRQQWVTMPTYTQQPYYLLIQRSDFATTQQFDTVARVPYLSRNTGSDATDQFVSYDDASSLGEKVAWIADQNIGGVMLWEAGEDFIPASSGADAKHPLITGMRDQYAAEYGRRPTIVEPYIPLYSPNAVAFNGSTYANRTLPYTGAADGKQWTGALAVKLYQRGAMQRIMRGNANNYAVTILDTWHFQLLGRTTAFVDCLMMQSSIQLDLNTWYTIYWSVDLADPAKRHIFINGVDRTGIVTTYNSAANINFNVGDNAVGAVHTGIQPFFGELADVWMEFGRYAAPTQINLRKFFDLYNRIVNKGSDGSAPFGTTPHVFLSGPTASWLTNNKGSGGDHVLLAGLLGTSLEPPPGEATLTEIGRYVQDGYVQAGYVRQGTLAPLAFPDVRDLSASETSADVDVLFNDADVSGATVTIQSAVTGATASVLGDQRIRVTRVGTASGSYSLTYRATTSGGSSEATLSGSIAALAVPVANDDVRNILASETTVDVPVLANDTNVAGGTISIVGSPSGITASVVGSQIRLTRIGTASGTYSVTYRVTTPVGFDDAVLSGSVAAAGGDGVGPIEDVNTSLPTADRIAITVNNGARQTWDGYGYGLGVGAGAFADRNFYQTNQVALFDELNTKAIRLHNPEEANFVPNYKPLVDFAVSKGVDRVLVTGYVWRTINTGGSASPTSFANAVHAAILGGIPITHVCLQNEPDGRPQETDGNAPPSVVDDVTVQLTGTMAQGLQNQLVADMTELRNRLNTLGHQVGGPSPVVVIGLEWAHFGSNGETEYNILDAAGAIPSIVGVGAGHCYKDCPANGLYDSRWLTKGLPLWSTETGNAGSPNAQARFVAALNHGAAVEMFHIGAESSPTADQGQILFGSGGKRPYHGAIRVISTALQRGTVMRLCTSSDAPSGLSATFANRMIRDGGQNNPRIQVAAGRRSDNRWFIGAVNATEGVDAPSSFLGAHYAAATLQVTVNVLEMAGMARAFSAMRSTINGTVSGPTTVNMQDGLIRFTLAAGETIALTQNSA